MAKWTVKRDRSDLDVRWMGRRTKDMRYLRRRKDRSWWRHLFDEIAALRRIGRWDAAVVPIGGRGK
jgi:hypothetical protein